MKKRTYIQPLMETMVLPKEVLMDGELILGVSGSGPSVGGGSGARRRTPVF